MMFGRLYDRVCESENIIKINVGGLRCIVGQKVISKFPYTRLGKLIVCESEEAILELCDDFDTAKSEFYFDRNPHLFNYVLNFYYTGKLHVMEGMCATSFSQEIEYWGISELCIHTCCSYKYHERRANASENDSDTVSEDTSIVSAQDVSSAHKEIEQFNTMWHGKHRKKLWLILENPDYSMTSKVVTVTSLIVILCSIIAMCINSLPEFQEAKHEHLGLKVLESFCILFFTMEYFLRFASTPRPRTFFINPINIIDLFSVLPFYTTLVVENISKSSSDLENIGRVVQVLRLMRIFRILKLARHSNGLKSLGATFRHSYDEVSLLGVFLSVGITIFASLIYSAEKEEKESGIFSIPIGWWWATISMTTVGYGDTYPVTITGKLIGSLCIIFGLLMVALPVTIIFNRFSKYYRREKAIVAALRNQEIKKLNAGLPSVNIRDAYAKKMRTTSNLRMLLEFSVYGRQHSSESLSASDARDDKRDGEKTPL